MRIIGFAEKNKGAGKEKNERDEYQEKLAEVEFRANLKNNERAAIEERNQLWENQMVAAIVLGDNKAMHEQNVTVGEDAHKAAVEMLATEQFTWEQERDLLLENSAPFDMKGGVEKISVNLTDEERTILGEMAGPGIDDNVEAVKAFAEKFATPMDLRPALIDYYDGLDDAKYNKLKPVEESLQEKIYGNRYERYKVLNKLNAEANKLAVEIERERSREWVPGSSSVRQLSAEQLRKGIPESLLNADVDGSCEDAVMADSKNQLYGVFDGATDASGSGRVAAHTARDTLAHFGEKYVNDCTSLAACLGAASELMRDNDEAGSTTAAAAKVVKFGEHHNRPMLSFAYAGDSHIYLIDKHGKTTELTSEKSDSIDGGKVQPKFGNVDLFPGSIVVLATKTGNIDKDALGKTAYNSHGVADATKNLMAAAIRSGVKEDCTFNVFVPKID